MTHLAGIYPGFQASEVGRLRGILEEGVDFKSPGHLGKKFQGHIQGISTSELTSKSQKSKTDFFEKLDRPNVIPSIL